jgi:hypothetical protein
VLSVQYECHTGILLKEKEEEAKHFRVGLVKFSGKIADDTLQVELTAAATDTDLKKPSTKVIKFDANNTAVPWTMP